MSGLARPLQPSVAAAATGGASFAGSFLGRFLRFGVVGASGAVINAGLLLLLVEGAGWPVLLASLLAIEASTLSNWALNRKWTWADRQGGWASLGRYHGVTAVGMAIQWLVLAATVSSLGWHYLLGALLGIAAGTLWNFAGNHLFSFRTADGKPLPRWALYAASFTIQILVAAVFAHPWDTFVFQRSVEDLLVRGQTPYQVAELAPSYTYWGGSLPALPMWYAYPPIPLALMVASYFPSALGWIPGAWVGRILIRLPFIAATLGAAAVARRLLAGAPLPTATHGKPAKAVQPVDPTNVFDGATEADLAAKRAQRAARAERLMLFNPLFIVIAALWGQFEALILLLLLLSVLALRHAQYARGGVWWALAVCVKIFPLYLVPLLAIHLHRTGGRRAVTRFAAAALAVGAAINLPFLLWSPRGYLQQVLLMHGQRSPARLAPLAYIDNLLELLSEAWPNHLPDPQVWSRWLGVVSLVLVVAVLLALAAASRRRPASEGRLLEWMALSLLGGLMATKVLNEQYLVLPLGLLLVARAHPQRALSPGVGRFVTLASWAVTAAGLLAGFNLLNALPPASARALLGGLAPEAIGRFALALGMTASQLRSILAWATGLFLLVPAILALRRLAGPVADGLWSLERAALVRLRSWHHGTRPVALAGLILLLCVAPLGVALSGGNDQAAAAQPLASGRPWALAEFTTSWYNPGNDVDRAQGTWEGVDVRPEAGYYTFNAHKAQTDLALAQAAGFDGIILDVHPFYEGYAGTLRRVAEANGVPYALGIDLAAAHTGHIGFEATTARQLRNTLQSPTLDYWTGRQHIVAPDGHAKVVFLSGVDQVQPTFTPAELAFVLDSWAQQGHGPTTIAALAAAAPASQADLLRDDAVATQWRAAYSVAGRAWWAQALDVEPRLAYLTDAPLPDGVTHWLGPRDADQPRALAPAGELRFTTLRGVLAPDTVRAGWAQARWAEADGAIVPWNDFAHGQAIEPTQAHGDATLRETALWIAAFKAPLDPERQQGDGQRGWAEQATDILPRRSDGTAARDTVSA